MATILNSAAHDDHHRRHQTQNNVRNPTSSSYQQRKRAIPPPVVDLVPLRTSLLHVSLQEEMHNSRGLKSTSLASAASSSTTTISAPAQGTHNSRVDSAIDLPEIPRPRVKASNRSSRVVPDEDIEPVEGLRDERLRQRPHRQPLASNCSRSSQPPHKNSPYSQSNNSSSNLLLDGCGETKEPKPLLPPLQISMDKKQQGNGDTKSATGTGTGDAEDGDDSYFGDILDKYCHSDDELYSPSTASPTSPFSTTSAWNDFRSPLPPTPPASSSRHQQNLDKAIASPRRATPLRNSTTQQSMIGGATAENNPILTASVRFNSYINTGSSSKDSRDSVSLNGHAVPSSSTTQQPSPTRTTRSYSKRPVPIPGDGTSAITSSRASILSTASFTNRNHSTPDLRDNRPEPPPKDSARRFRNSSTSQLSLLSSETFSSGPLHTFSEVVEAARRRNKVASISSVSSLSVGGVHPYAENATINDQSEPYQNQLSQLPSGSRHQNIYHQGQTNTIVSMSHSQSSDERMYYQQRQQQRLHEQKQVQRQNARSQESPYYLDGEASHQLSRTSLSPSEMLSQRFDDRAAIMRQESFSSIASSRHQQHQHLHQDIDYDGSQRLKSSLSKTPIARSRARDVHHGPRKVIFGDMITIVSIERPETPPPPPSPTELKKRAKLKKKKSKKGSSKAGPHPDPEYDSDYYNAPYTQEPAEVVVTLAPWIGNPNYDEDKQNSKFYYLDEEEEYEDEDYGYDASYDGDIRGGNANNDDDEEDDEDEDDEEEDGFGSDRRAWDNARGAVSPKKKGGIFKFKRAVNRLLRN
ncbi:hypothetical protein BGX28_010506 [Mortierella sp. GBA30]|nr:hypothetical protein BGX28_010506 [Mortierella sp. GBA30]